jgi:hypothetical protein
VDCLAFEDCIPGDFSDRASSAGDADGFVEAGTEEAAAVDKFPGNSFFEVAFCEGTLFCEFCEDFFADFGGEVGDAEDVGEKPECGEVEIAVDSVWTVSVGEVAILDTKVRLTRKE